MFDPVASKLVSLLSASISFVGNGLRVFSKLFSLLLFNDVLICVSYQSCFQLLYDVVVLVYIVDR